jgi:hypothetical protein
VREIPTPQHLAQNSESYESTHRPQPSSALPANPESSSYATTTPARATPTPHITARNTPHTHEGWDDN